MNFLSQSETHTRKFKRIVFFISFSLGIILAEKLASFSWQLLDFYYFKTSLPKFTSKPVEAISVNENDDVYKLIKELDKLSVFGKQKVIKTDKVNLDERPTTSLSLKLNGLLISDEHKKSIAIINFKNKQKSYSVNDEIESGVFIQQISSDGVLIDEHGKITKLIYSFEQNKEGQSKNQSAIDSSVPIVNENFKGELMSSPQKIFDYISISPMKENGNLMGYRLNPGKEPALFEQLGFQAGDIAIEMNGIDLKDEIASLSLLAELPQLTFASIHVQRGQETHIIEVNLED